jgi:hypothetical protein
LNEGRDKWRQYIANTFAGSRVGAVAGHIQLRENSHFGHDTLRHLGEITLAKKPERGVKSQAIRDYLRTHKGAKASEVVAALAEQGIEVSTAMVYNLKARRSMGRRRRKAQARGETVNLSIDQLLAAKRFVEAAGGLRPAQEALAIYAKIA